MRPFRSDLETKFPVATTCGFARNDLKAANYIGREKPSYIGLEDSDIGLSHHPPVPHPLLFLISTSPKVELNMKNRTETLEIGSPAPDFSLGAANREGTFTLVACSSKAR